MQKGNLYLGNRWKFVFQQVGLIFFFIVLFFFSRTMTIDFVNFTWRFSLIFSGIIGGWLLFFKKNVSPLSKPLIVWVGVYILSTIVSDDPRRSFSQMLLMLQGVLLFVMVAELVAQGFSRELIINNMLFAGAVIILFGWLEVLIWYRAWLSYSPTQWIPDISYRISWPNNQAALFNVLFQMGLYVWLVKPNKLNRAILTLYLFADGMLLLLSSSRGAWLGAAVGAMLQVGLWGWKNFSVVKAGLQRLLARRLALMGIVILFLVMSGILIGLMQSLINHPSHATNAIDARSEYWPAAWDTFIKHPILGNGPFTYADRFFTYNSVPPKGIYNHAHSLPLNILAEMGLAGFLAAGWIGWSGIAHLLNEIWKKTFVSPSDYSIMALAALCAYGTHTIVDVLHGHWIPIGWLALLILLGVALAKPEPIVSRHWIVKRPWWVIALIASLGWLVYAEIPTRQGIFAANQGNWQESVEAFEEAVKRDPWSLSKLQQLGIAESMLKSPAALSESVRIFERIVSEQPEWAIHHINLGNLYLQQGRWQEAQAQMEIAVITAPDYFMATLNYAIVSEEMGDSVTARQSYAKTLELFPLWATSTFWEKTDLRCSVYSEWNDKRETPQTISISDMENKLRESPGVYANYLELAQAYIREGRIEDASFVMRKSQFVETYSLMERLKAKELKEALGIDVNRIHVDQNISNEEMFSVVSMSGASFNHVVFREGRMEREFVNGVNFIPLTLNSSEPNCGNIK